MKKVFYLILALGWAILIWRLTTVPDFKVTEDSLMSFLISNAGHFIFFGIQAALLRLNSLTQNSSIAIVSLYGLIIELVQRNVPGRSADPIDWILDTLGAIVFLYILKKSQINLRIGEFKI